MVEPTEQTTIENKSLKFIELIESPIKFFGLVVLVCDSTFAFAAASLGDPESFKYCIHMFLATSGFFGLTALWSPRSLYHPKELINIPNEKLPAENPKVPTIVITVILLIYFFYQGIK